MNETIRVATGPAEKLRLANEAQDAADRERAAEALVMAEVESLAASLFAFREAQIDAAEKRDELLRASGVTPQPEARPLGRVMVGSGIDPLVRLVYEALFARPTNRFANTRYPPLLLVLSDERQKRHPGGHPSTFPDASWMILVDGEERYFDEAGKENSASTAQNVEWRARTIPLPAWAGYDLPTLRAAAEKAREGADRHEGRARQSAVKGTS